MTSDRPPPPASGPRAGGALIALGTIGGTVVGTAAGQPTLGLLAGLGASVAGALLLWLRDRRR